jgi:hypothetical protein
MSASSPAEKKSATRCELPLICYSLFLVFPVVTLILLSTNFWLPDRSPCDKEMTHQVYVPPTPPDRSSDTEDKVLPVGQYIIKTMPCTCRPEFPVTASVLAGMDILIFFSLIYLNPLVNGIGKKSSEKCPSCLSVCGVITYLFFLVGSFWVMSVSNPLCGAVIFLWTCVSFLVHLIIMMCSAIAWDGFENDQTSSLDPIEL